MSRHPWILLIILMAQAWHLAAADLRVPVTDHGAKGDGRTLDTVAIQAAIDAVARNGGGTVVIPAGTFRSGAIFLKPGANLHLDRDAVLKGSTDINDYPKIPTRIEGHTEPWRTALVNADGVDRLAITGEGTLDGSGHGFWKAFWDARKADPKVTNLAVERPRLLFIQKSIQVTVRGIHLLDSGFWNLHLYRCREVTVDGLTITAGGQGMRCPSTDGIDVDSCQDVRIRACTIRNDDDCIAMKGSKGPDADQDADSPPVERITIENCRFEGGHAAITCGSEASVIRDVTVIGCTVAAPIPLLNFKLRPDTPQLYEHFNVRDCIMANDRAIVIKAAPWTQFFDLKGHQPPVSNIRNIRIANLTGSCASLGYLKGHDRATINDVTMSDITLTVTSGAFPAEVKNLVKERVELKTRTTPPKTGQER